MADIKTGEVGAGQVATAASVEQSAAAPTTGGVRAPAAGARARAGAGAGAGNQIRSAPASSTVDSAEAQRLQSRSETHRVYSTAYVEIERRAEAMREMASSAAARDSADGNGRRWAQEDLRALPFVRDTEREIALQAVARSVAANRAYAVAIATADAELRHRDDVNGLDVMEIVAERAAAVPEYRQAMEEVAPELLKEADAYVATQPPGFTVRAKFQEVKARAEHAVDVELELEAEVERDETMLAGAASQKKAGGVELGSRPPAVARAAATAAAGAAVGVKAAEAPKPGVVPPAPNKAAARESAVAEEELEDDELAEEDEALRRRRAAEAAQSATLDNAVDARPSGKELAREEIIIPRRIVQSYDQVDGKFFAKDSSRMMFEDKGLKLATSGTNKETIADMVALARAKNWQSIKLTGAQEFRREAWLQAESQGVKTQGYTPKEADLAALKALTQERATNMIAPVAERGQARAASSAPAKQQPVQQQPITMAARHDLNKNQAAMHVAAMQNMAANLQVLREKPGLEQRTGEEMQNLAYWRGIVEEESKGDPARQREALERFDLQTRDPEFVKRIASETRGTIKQTVERVQKRDTHEQSL